MAMKRFAAPSLGAIAAAAALLLPGAAHALFEDGDARRAILDLRAQVEQLHKADQGAIAEIQQVRSILMELQGQIGVLRNEVASLRGQNEELQQNLRTARPQPENRPISAASSRVFRCRAMMWRRSQSGQARATTAGPSTTVIHCYRRIFYNRNTVIYFDICNNINFRRIIYHLSVFTKQFFV